MTNDIIEMTLLGENDKYCRGNKIVDLKDNIGEIKRIVQSMYGTSISWGADITDIMSPLLLKSAFQNIETGMRLIKENTDYLTPHTNETEYVWEDLPVDIKVELNRWFQWSNEQKEVFDTVDEGCQPLCDDYRELTRDINDSIIFVEVE